MNMTVLFKKTADASKKFPNLENFSFMLIFDPYLLNYIIFLFAVSFQVYSKTNVTTTIPAIKITNISNPNIVLTLYCILDFVELYIIRIQII